METYQQTIITMLVKQKRARLKLDGDLLLRRPAIMGVKDSLAANAPVGRRREIEQQSPRGAGRDRVPANIKGYIVIIII